MKVARVFVTGTHNPKGGYLASVLFELASGPYRFQVNGFRLVALNSGVRLINPNIKNARGDWKDIFFPCNQETKELLEQAALEAWRRIKGQEVRDLLEPL